MIVFLFIYPNFAGKDKENIGIIQILRQLSTYLEWKQGFPCVKTLGERHAAGGAPKTLHSGFILAVGCFQAACCLTLE